MSGRYSMLIVLLGCAAALLGCSADADQRDEAPSPAESDVGSLRVQLLAAAQTQDVTAVQLSVGPADQPCGTAAVKTATVPLAQIGVSQQPLVAALFVLPPGAYRVCAVPLAFEVPSKACAAAESLAMVVAEGTAEVSLVAQCEGAKNGAVEVIATLNSAPTLTNLIVTPSPVISTCQAVHLAVEASDPEHDALSFDWKQVQPDASTLDAMNDRATFFSPTEGVRHLRVQVTDAHGASASLDFPIHTVAGHCQVPADVQALFDLRCKSCHGGAKTSAGLSLADPETSFANLVGHHAAGMGCGDRTRAVPANAESSYIVAKVRGTAGICGMRMPRGGDPLTEAEMAIITGWINGL